MITVRPICAPNRVPQEHEASTTIKDSQAVWSEATRKTGSTAVRPTCAPNRVPQEHEASATIKDSQAVWSNATRKKPANLPGRSWQELPFPPWQVILPPNNIATKAPEAQLPKEHLEPRGSETTVSLKPGGPSPLLLSRRSGLSSPCQTEML
jgi:hypothetical protein